MDRPLWMIEGWRGLAALAVLWAHWGGMLGWPMGIMGFAFTAVDLFFVLSGVVFAPRLLGLHTQGWGRYALLRLSRIYPAYLVALALYMLVAWGQGQPLLHVAEHLTMTHLQTREMAFYYNAAFWSLPVELAFYLLVPLLGALWLRLPRTLAESWTPLLALMVLAFWMRAALLLQANGHTQNLAYVLLNHLPGWLLEFLLGTAIWRHAYGPRGALASGTLGRLRARTAWAMAALGVSGWLLTALVFVAIYTQYAPWVLGQLSLPAALCFALVVRASLELPPAPVWARPLVEWAGRLSYPVYLLHMLWLPVAQQLVAQYGVALGSAPALLGLALSCWLLHVLVEEPARRWGRQRAGRAQYAPALPTS